MLGFKRSTKAVQPAAIIYTTDPDQAYRAAWGFTLSEWLEMDDDARRDYRDRVAHAPKLRTVSA